jgi:hypothetical protein
MIRKIKSKIHSVIKYIRLPSAAKAERDKDSSGIPLEDHDIGNAIETAIGWICRAQDKSESQDGGVARHYSLITGWCASYPETTGYIIPTILADANWRKKNSNLRERARRMLDWLVSIQLENGAFAGGPIGNDSSDIPVAFNTGQILFGLVAGVHEFGNMYLSAMKRAANWLLSNQDPDGCWRKYASPYVIAGEKTYDTHIAWALLEATRVEPDRLYEEAALSNVTWALNFQRENGWFDKCCLSDPSKPLTHTVGYALRGLVEAYKFTKDNTLLEACCKTADGLFGAIHLPDGFLAGRNDSQWTGKVPWSCLTGSVQIAICFLMLYQFTGELRYKEAGCVLNQYVRRTMSLNGPDDIKGGIKGSFPVNLGYGPYQYLNWACKFFIDSNMLEMILKDKKI